MDFAAVAEMGATGALIVVVIMFADVLRKRFRKSEMGERREYPEVIGCPNKIEGLAETMVVMRDESTANRKLQTEQLRVLEHVCAGTDRLVEQHKAGTDGVEAWKINPRMLKLQEESRDLLRDLVAVVKQNGFK